ncbi:hypothetical protein BGX24_012609 [Mortierella sp. AD032]|nr:hypothetical protein BGX24_012609 [Mortierella sp. AD032]
MRNNSAGSDNAANRKHRQQQIGVVMTNAMRIGFMRTDAIGTGSTRNDSMPIDCMNSVGTTNAGSMNAGSMNADKMNVGRNNGVCQLWNQVFVPGLWRSIDDEKFAWPRFLRHHKDRDADSTDNSSNNANSNEEQKALVQAVWRLAQQNSTTLTCFRLDQSFSRPRSLLNTSEAAEVMYNALENMPNLIELEIAHASADLDRVLHLTSPHLECLRAPGLFQMMGTDGQLLHEAYTSIRKVELSNDTDTRAVFSLLRYLPNLESLSLSGFEQEFFQNDEVEGLEAQTRMDNTPNRSLHRLSLCKVRFHDNRVMAIILPWIPELREFSCDLLRMDMSAALVKHCTHLEIVRELGVLGGNYDAWTKTRPIDDVLPLLRGCPSLKVLDMVAHRIQGDSFIDCEIACLERLETFRCQIVGMYWLGGIHSLEMLKRILARNSGEGDEGSERGPWQAGTRAAEMRLFDKAYRNEDRGPAPVGTRCAETRLFNEVYRNQERYRKVYHQLSKMTQLRVLDLGQEYRTVFDPYCGPDGEDSHNSEDEEHHPPKYNRYSPSIPDTLDLTLESGFDQLETLKELEVFGFEGVGHHLDKAELNWMAEKWPKLRVMRGIHEDILPKVEPDAKRTELREYMQLLRPDVVHETLYKLPVFWSMEAADVW